MSREFFNRNPEIVARELLGKILVRKIGNKELKARIVETEAYFDEKDPASRACKNGDLRETMKMDAGIILIYGVHNNWLINFVTGSLGEASAVLIRAVEPLNFNKKCNGPGLLTKALRIKKEFHKKNIANNKELWIEDLTDNKTKTNINDDNNSDTNNTFEIVESFRIGVTKDLEMPLRFYIKENRFVSRK